MASLAVSARDPSRDFHRPAKKARQECLAYRSIVFPGRCDTPVAPRRPAFTLLEIMMVLAVIVVVAAVSYPAFEGWFQSHRLQQGVDTIRTMWVKARTFAMDEGRPYRFAYVAEAGQYRLAPHDLEHWQDLGATAPSVPLTGTSAPGMLIEDVLPEGVGFITVERLQGTNPYLSAGGWCKETILFWPDGTARIYSAEGAERPNTEVFIADKSGRTMMLHLRGLTGGVSVYGVRGQ